MNKNERVFIALDVGDRRIGVARAVVPPRIAQPLMALEHDDTVFHALQALCEAEQPTAFVVGLPRNQEGELTAQSKKITDWADRYLAPLGVPIYWQDESLTSVMAEAELEAKKRHYTKHDVDALAATIVLTDYLEMHT